MPSGPQGQAGSLLEQVTFHPHLPDGQEIKQDALQRSLHQSRAEEGEEAMSNASDSTVEQTKEIIYTVILLNFTKREKNASDDLQVEKKTRH